MSRKSNGEGSIFKRKDGRWQAVLTLGFDDNGKLIRRYFYGSTRKEAVEKMTAFQRNMEHNPAPSSELTLAEWTDTWLDLFKKNNVKPRTLEQYESVIRLYLKPNLGDLKLGEITSLQVQAMLNKMHENGLSRRTLELTKVVLRAALNQAKKINLIQALPTDDVVLPKKAKLKPTVLSEEEQTLLVQELVGNYVGRAIIFALYTGLRRGEVLALKWTDFDENENTIEITKTLGRVKTFDTTKGKTTLSVGSPKTESSCRTVPLVNSAIALLKRHKQEQENYKSFVGEYYHDQNLIFSSSTGGYIDPGNLNRKLKKVAKNVGLSNISSHAMRHTFATRGLEAGVSLKAMQEFLGHSSIQITGDIYTHILKKQQKKEIAKLNEFFN